MDKEIILKDYAGEECKYIIKNFENVVAMCINVLSGDETCMVLYKDKTEAEFDSGKGCRLTSYYDGSYFIAPDEIDKFSNTEGNTYDRMVKWYGW